MSGVGRRAWLTIINGEGFRKSINRRARYWSRYCLARVAEIPRTLDCRRHSLRTVRRHTLLADRDPVPKALVDQGMGALVFPERVRSPVRSCCQYSTISRSCARIGLELGKYRHLRTF